MKRPRVVRLAIRLWVSLGGAGLLAVTLTGLIGGGFASSPSARPLHAGSVSIPLAIPSDRTNSETVSPTLTNLQPIAQVGGLINSLKIDQQLLYALVTPGE